MRSLGYLAGALMMVMLLASSTLARVAMIETAAPIKNHTEDAVKAAIQEAVDTAAKGAVAMGLPWVQLRDAEVLEDTIAIQVVATDEAPQQVIKNHKEDAPGTEQAPGAGNDLGPDCEQPPQPDQHVRPGRLSTCDKTANF
jgi:hypothetical protein